MMNFGLLIAYILSNLFLMWREKKWLSVCIDVKKHKWILPSFTIVYTLIASCLIVWIWIPWEKAAVVIQKVGNFWYDIFSILFFFVLVLDLMMAVWYVIAKMRKRKFIINQKLYAVAGGLILLITAIFTAYGSVNARTVVCNSYQAKVAKSVSGMKQLKIALVADLHMGHNAGCMQMEKMVEQINAIHPDIVVLAGDIFDNDYDALDNPKRLIQIFQTIQSRYGVYAVYGNHDVRNTLVGGFTVSNDSKRDKRMDTFLTKSHIHILEDTIVPVNHGKFYVIGRIDEEEPGIPGKRKSIAQLMAQVDQKKPVIMINHEPDHLEDYEKCGVDVFLGGHTHNGQMFPLTIARHWKWENPAGFLKIGRMNSFVTQGVGAYGPYMRTFTQSEVMAITLHFDGK